eukprot:CAMPEP_0170305884 /NCGR_PEP_ID=MMETSP0116_2-20130129/53322_1 /TAXON_ID=400756 /ORGANISM="Durinskia baltica, Strain CSIRO CS-38" /LENGTH=59 /DNA_ID=CAMNT_0010557947 /DNA_START=55 /DNA_END=230 /DNA_ORIENTATION=-
MDAAAHGLEPSHMANVLWRTVDSEVGRPFIIPLAGIAVGVAMLTAPGTRTARRRRAPPR